MTKETTDPVSIAVITGEKQTEDGLRQQLSLWAESLCVSFRFLVWRGTEDSRPGPLPSLLFLDLRSGLQSPTRVPGWLEEALSSCAVVILSEDQIQAIQAYQWHPVDRLAPDFTYGALCRTMDRCFRFWRQGLEWLDLPFQWDRVRVPLSQIHYAEGQGRDTILHCTGGEIRVSVPLSKLEPLFPSPPFFRCQKSFMVHPDAVERLAGGDLILKDRLAVTVSRNRKKEIQALLERWQNDRGNGP